jgi:hypothetical protein
VSVRKCIGQLLSEPSTSFRARVDFELGKDPLGVMPRGVTADAKLPCYGGIGLPSSQQLCHFELASGKAISLAQIVRPDLTNRIASLPGRLGSELNSELTHLVERTAKLVNQVPTVLAECRDRGEQME